MRKASVDGCTIRYVRRPEDETAEDKLSWLGGADLKASSATTIKPDQRHSWINLADNDFDELLPIHTKAETAKGIFDLCSMGIVTARDEWVYDESEGGLSTKVEFLISAFNEQRKALKDLRKGQEIDFDASIKWSESLKRNLKILKSAVSFDETLIVEANYRPFSKASYYADTTFSDRLTNLHFQIFGNSLANRNASISLMGDSSGTPFFTLAIDRPPDLNFVSPASGGTRTLPRYRYTKSGERVDNITDWAVAQFRAAYGAEPSPLEGRGGSSVAAEGEGESDGEKATLANARSGPSPNLSPEGERDSTITKDAIFAYCYAVLHDPLYREKYALNLKREFPRIPFYPDFARWAAWGEALLALHIDYEQAKPFKFNRIDTPNQRRAEGTHPKPKLKSDPATGSIQIDEDTQLTGIPAAAWQYRLGNRSAIDWVLDQHKEKTPRDPTIRAKFNSYRFADYKEACIALLSRVVTVSLGTVTASEAMKNLDRSNWE